MATERVTAQTFTTLHSFFTAFSNTNSDGVFPEAGLLLSGNTLYGTVFSLSFPSPQLTITRSGTNVNLTWPSGVAGYSYSAFTLQSTTNLASPAVWSTVPNTSVVVNTNNAVTNSISGAQTFYRLSQ
jgi:hypothetical protein